MKLGVFLLLIFLLSCNQATPNLSNKDESFEIKKEIIDSERKENSKTNIDIENDNNAYHFYNLNGNRLCAALKNHTIYDEASLYEINQMTLGNQFVHTIQFVTDDVNNEVKIAFKMLSNKPLWIYTNKLKDINKYIEVFDYVEYVNSKELDDDIDVMMKEEVLSSNYLLESLGKPDLQYHTANNNKSIETWYYEKCALYLILENNKVINYTHSIK